MALMNENMCVEKGYLYYEAIQALHSKTIVSFELSLYNKVHSVHNKYK